jgi:hypothetical protein
LGKRWEKSSFVQFYVNNDSIERKTVDAELQYDTLCRVYYPFSYTSFVPTQRFLELFSLLPFTGDERKRIIEKIIGLSKEEAGDS